MLPIIYLGLPDNFKNKDDYNDKISSYIDQIPNYESVILVSSQIISEKEIIVFFNVDTTNPKLISQIKSIQESISSEIPFKIKNRIEYEKTFPNWLKELSKIKNIIVLSVPNNRKIVMILGKLFQPLRSQNVLLLGLGNITYISSQVSDDLLDNVIDFDSWVRVKIFEFDYYALRDFENYFPEDPNNFLENSKHYIPFLFIFGAYEGSDELIDIFSGFDGLKSLRSFALAQSGIKLHK